MGRRTARRATPTFYKVRSVPWCGTFGEAILLGDKKAGPFKLEVEWIKAVETSR